MIEKICPKCKIPMPGDKCVNKKCGHATISSSTIYWCKECNVPLFEKECAICGSKGDYIATDLRPVFPEECLLLSLILKKDPTYYQDKSVWYGSNVYIVDGKKERVSVSALNKWSVEIIDNIRKEYETRKDCISYSFFNSVCDKFVRANSDRYNYLTEEAVNYIQRYTERFSLEDMMVSFSGGKDSTVTSHLVNR